MIEASDRIRRNTEQVGLGWGRLKVSWKRWAKCISRPNPVKGIYIGYRTGSNGHKHYEDDCGFIYQPEDVVEYWLIVPDARERPVKVFPEDTRWLDNG